MELDMHLHVISKLRVSRDVRLPSPSAHGQFDYNVTENIRSFETFAFHFHCHYVTENWAHRP